MGSKAKAQARRRRQKLNWQRNHLRQCKWQEQDFMIRGNTQRWNWLMETFKGLPPEEQSNIRTEFADRYDNAGRPDDQVMHEIMTEMGIVPKGTDPRPPPKVYVTDAGAAEYEEVMVIQELGKSHDAT